MGYQGIDLGGSIDLATFLASGDGRELTFEQLPFDHPLFILYSSGTSGPPKCIVHSAGVGAYPRREYHTSSGVYLFVRTHVGCTDAVQERSRSGL